ncbi:MAG: lamin tail domain-containing protein [Acidobacteriota bacterium]
MKRAVVSLVCVVCLVSSSLLAATVFSKVTNPSRIGAGHPDLASSPQVATLVINEYLADPPDGAAGDANGDGTRDAANDEFVEIVNDGAAPLDVGLFTISDATQVRFTIPAGKIIPAGEAAVIFGGGTPTGAFGNCSANGLVFSVGGGGLSLNNGGDTITVKDNLAVTVATLTFTTTEGNANQSITRSPDVTGSFTPHASATGSGGALFSPGARVNGAAFTSTDPVITSISPDEATLGSGDVPITVTGANFQNGSHVRVDGAQLTTGFVSGESLTATIPAAVTNVAGTHAVTVENPNTVVSNSAQFTVTVPTELIINEYLADPPDGTAGDANGDGVRDSADDEFVEIVNTGANPLPVGGFTISDATQVRFTIPAGKIIPPGEAAVVFGGGTPTGAFGNCAANGLVFAAGSGGLSLNNGGDTITIKDGAAVTVASVTFGSTEGNANQSITRSPDITGAFTPHSSATGSGGSLFSPGARVNGAPFVSTDPMITSISPDGTTVGSGDVPITVTGENFQDGAHVRVDGAPLTTGFVSAESLTATIPASVTSVPGPHPVTVENPNSVVSNSVPFTVTVPTQLIINEYLADPPDGIAGDANGDGVRDSNDDEFVELVNTGAFPLNVGLFTISDATQVRFTIPAGKIIPAGEAAVVFGGGTPTGAFGNCTENGLVFAVGAGGLSLNNGGDTITIKDGAVVVVASVTYGSTEGNANQSITRSPDISGAFTPHVSAAGSGGALFSPGARVNGSPFTTTDAVIDSISPVAVVAGSGATPIVVTGQNFVNGSTVRVDGSPVSTMFSSPTELNAEIPASVTGSPGTHAVTVQNPDLAVSNPATFVVLSVIGLNEFLADPPEGAAGDANGDGVRDTADDEFVEIVNRTNTPIDVSGFSVHDAAASRFTFPSGTVIPAREAAIVFGGGSPQGEFGNAMPNGLVFTAALSLNNAGDTVTITDGGGMAVESVSYGSGEGNADQSINRNPEVVGTSFVIHSSVAGSGGRLFSPGTFVTGQAFTIGPRITGIAPDHAPLDSAPFDILVDGSGFEGDSVVVIDSLPVATMFLNSGRLSAQVPSSVTSVAGAHPVRVRNAGGNRSNPATLTIVPPPPVLLSVIPRLIVVGAGNVVLFVSGEHFDPGAKVLVEDTLVTTTFINARELRATVPATFTSTVGIRTLRVRSGDGQLSNILTFEVVQPFTRITSISPTEVVAGAPGFVLSVTGANFKAGASVLFDQSPLVTKFVSASQLQADVPAALIAKVGLRAISAQNSDGGPSNDVIFRVKPDAPLIAAIDPSSVLEGSGAVTVAITGDKFQPGARARAFREGKGSLLIDASRIDGQRIEAKVPADFLQTAGSVLLSIENPDFGVSNTATLKVLIKDPLVINEFLADPAEGDAGDANGDGNRSSSQDEFVEIVNRTGEPFDISGYKLSDADALRHVFAAGTVIPPFEAVVVFGGGTPKGAFGNAADNQLVLKASTGGLSLNNGGDTIRLEDAQGHVVQEIKFNAAQGGAGQSINRDPDLGGATFSLHANVADSGAKLFSPGAKVNGSPFTTKPRISALSPASAQVGSAAFTLVITGTDFLPGAVILFGDKTLETVFASGSQLEAQVTAALVTEGGAINVRVRNPKGELSSIAKFIVADDPPRALKLTPQKTGTGAENLVVRIEGERFQRGAQATIKGEAVETRFVSSSMLEIVAPDKFFKVAAELEVRVTNADGSKSNPLTLSVENGPLITRLSRKKVKAGKGEAQITISGVAFKSDVLLFVGDTPVPTTFVSDASLTARIPASMTNQPGSLSLQARHADGGRSNKVTLKVVN